MSAELIGKLHNLAERRRAHFIDLYESGRWKHYYSETEFSGLMRDVARLADDWRRISTPTPE
jgi:hypothetical protein